ncbi:MAG: PKD domain-containing protein, partial [Pseudomonadota bacterium]
GNYANNRRHTFRNPDNFAYIFGAADFNGDGIFDYRQYSNPAPMAEISTGEFDNDGLPVYTIRQDAPMLRGNRKHGFVHMRDIDGDGDTDYVLSSMLRNFGGLTNTFEGMRTEMVINQGLNSGVFQTFVGDDWGREESMDMKIIDINLDGNMDMFVAHPNRYGVYMNSAPPKVVELGALVSAPVESGLAVTLQSELLSGDRVSYRWDFGDGQSMATDDPTVNHVYANPGRYLVTLTAEGPFGSDESIIRQRVHEPLLGAGRSSTSIAVSESDNRLWVVNPDNNSVSVIDSQSGNLIAEIPVGLEPVSLWLHNDLIYVVNKSHASVSIITTDDLSVQRTEWLRYASRPHAILVDPAGSFAYIAHEVTNEIRKYALPGFELAAQLTVGPSPRHLAMNSSGTQLYAPLFITQPQPGESTRAVSNASGAEIRVIATDALALLDTIMLSASASEDTDISARGIPNYL